MFFSLFRGQNPYIPVLNEQESHDRSSFPDNRRAYTEGKAEFIEKIITEANSIAKHVFHCV